MDDTLEHLDRLYELLPAIYRIRDADQGYALKALLRVIAEQAGVVEQDIARLYDNWFIETAQDWVVPYIGDLIGYRPVHEAGEPGDASTTQGLARNKILIPRREVAKTIAYRRRKGALALLEVLANDVTGWPARAVEFYKSLGWTQNVNHPRDDRGRTMDLRDGDALDLRDTPFDQSAHTVDVRRANSTRSAGRYNIPSVGLFVWRLKTYAVNETPAHCLEEVGPYCFTFSVLGQDTPLYAAPLPEPGPTHIAREENLPVPIRRRAFEQNKDRFYGAGKDKSLAVWASGWAGRDEKTLIPVSKVKVADLSKWHYRARRDTIAIDPIRGRIAFPPSQLPKRNVWVSYRYGFSSDIGGGTYDRALSQPQEAALYPVGEEQPYKNIGEALRRWKLDLEARDGQPVHAIIELVDNGVYVEQLDIVVPEDHSLQLRAADGKRPVIRLLDWHTDQPDALTVHMARGSRFTLDGLMVTGRAVHIRGAAQDNPAEICPAEVVIRHCTLVPGWGLRNDCEPRRPAEPSLELFNVRAQLTLQHSIVGTIQINEDAVLQEPIPVHISDSVVDATEAEQEAIGAPGCPVAHCVLSVRRSTVFGIVDVHAIELAENSIFMDCVNVARRQRGCMRFCYVPHGCRTPKRYHCQPEHAEQTAIRTMLTHAERSRADKVEAERERQRERVRPQFNSIRYGRPGYCQLAGACADEIKRGADDESEMGVFHDLFQPQRSANLRARLDEYTPAGVHAGVIYAS